VEAVWHGTGVAQAFILAAMSDPALSATEAQAHTLFDDIQGFVIGGVLTSLGVAMFGAGGLMTAGTAGIAFLLHYVTGLGVGLMFFAVNIPFFLLAYSRMGRVFTLKSFASVTLLSVLVDLMPHFLVFGHVAAPYSAFAGGLLLGMGVLAFVRHGSSLGGINILAVYLQQKHGLRAGKIQMAIDALIATAAFFLLPPMQVLYSVLGAVTLGAVLAINHKPGRYMGV
jgi:uncharacterized membrane-anchored protein YitT (DUF2179 family)